MNLQARGSGRTLAQLIRLCESVEGGKTGVFVTGSRKFSDYCMRIAEDYGLGTRMIKLGDRKELRTNTGGRIIFSAQPRMGHHEYDAIDIDHALTEVALTDLALSDLALTDLALSDLALTDHALSDYSQKFASGGHEGYAGKASTAAPSQGAKDMDWKSEEAVFKAYSDALETHNAKLHAAMTTTPAFTGPTVEEQIAQMTQAVDPGPPQGTPWVVQMEPEKLLDHIPLDPYTHEVDDETSQD